MEKETNYRVIYFTFTTQYNKETKEFSTYDEIKQYYYDNRNNSNLDYWFYFDKFNHIENKWKEIGVVNTKNYFLEKGGNYENYFPFSEDLEENRIIDGNDSLLDEDETIDFLINSFCREIASKVKRKLGKEDVEALKRIRASVKEAVHDNTKDTTTKYKNRAYHLSADFIRMHTREIIARLMADDFYTTTFH